MFFRSPRFWLAGPITLITAYLVMAGMPLWFPEGSGGVNHLAFSMVLFPLLWITIFIYACLDERLVRVGIILFAIILLNVLAISWVIWS